MKIERLLVFKNQSEAEEANRRIHYYKSILPQYNRHVDIDYSPEEVMIFFEASKLFLDCSISEVYQQGYNRTISYGPNGLKLDASRTSRWSTPMKLVADASTWWTNIKKMFSGKNWFSDGINNWGLAKPQGFKSYNELTDVITHEKIDYLSDMDYVEIDYDPNLIYQEPDDTIQV